MKYNKAIDSYISHLFESHEVRTSEDHPYFIFWVKDGKVIAEIENSKYFWLHYQIWDSISSMFELGYSETQFVIKIWLKQHHNFGELTPSSEPLLPDWLLEQHHNLG